MPKPPLVRSNNDDRRQWRKQGVVVGAAASTTQAERSGEYLYKNVTGDKYQPIFEGGVDYFKI